MMEESIQSKQTAQEGGNLHNAKPTLFNEENGESVVQTSESPSPESYEWAVLLDNVKREAEENWNRYLRAQAEMENLRRRNERELQSARQYAVEPFVSELLAVCDSLEMGIEAGRESQDIEKIQEGSELTLRLLSQTMEKFGIKELIPLDEKFNPVFHEAMAMQESDTKEPNTVLMVIQKGYLLHDRLIRPARVIVAKAPKGS